MRMTQRGVTDWLRACAGPLSQHPARTRLSRCAAQGGWTSPSARMHPTPAGRAALESTCSFQGPQIWEVSDSSGRVLGCSGRLGHRQWHLWQAKVAARFPDEQVLALDGHDDEPGHDGPAEHIGAGVLRRCAHQHWSAGRMHAQSWLRAPSCQRSRSWPAPISDSAACCSMAGCCRSSCTLLRAGTCV